MRMVGTIPVVALWLAVGVCPGVGMSAMIRLGLEQLTRGADMIVLGTITHRVSAWNDRHSEIYTDVTVDVEEAMKGSPGMAVAFRVAGGVIGEIGMGTSTDASFEPGERVIVFLHREGHTARLFGRRQGKFSVSHGTVTHEGQVRRVADFMAAIRAASR